MARHLGRALVFLALALQLSGVSAFGKSSGRRLQGSAIYNGQTAPQGRFRFLASLRARTAYYSGHTCGGTLIHPRVVLTAAHCVKDIVTGEMMEPGFSLPTVRLGGYRLTRDSPDQYQERSTVRVVPHPNFKTGFAPVGPTYNFVDNDVALLLLDRPSTMPTVTLAPFKPKPGNPLPDNTSLLVTGWGNLQYYTLAEELQQLTQTLLPLSTCQKALGKVSFRHNGIDYDVRWQWQTNNIICAARDYPKLPSTTCSGDSGSPLLLPGLLPGQDLQVGVLSFGPSSCDPWSPFYPTGYANLGALRPWIAQEVKRLTGDTLPDPSLRGAVVNDTKVLGFDGARSQYTGKPGTWMDVMSSSQFRFTGKLARMPGWGKTALQSLVWALGDRVVVEAGASRMRVWVNNRLVGSGTQQKIRGGFVRFEPRLLTRPPSAARWVTIEQPGMGLSIHIEQRSRPTLRTPAPWLDAWVTLTRIPATQLHGELGRSLRLSGGRKAAGAASKEQASVRPLKVSVGSVLPKRP